MFHTSSSAATDDGPSGGKGGPFGWRRPRAASDDARARAPPSLVAFRPPRRGSPFASCFSHAFCINHKSLIVIYPRPPTGIQHNSRGAQGFERVVSRWYAWFPFRECVIHITYACFWRLLRDCVV